MPFEKGRKKTGGRTKGISSAFRDEIRKMACDAAPQAIATLIELSKSADKDSVRFSAARELLYLSYGRPVAADNPVDDPADVTHLEIKLVKADGNGNAQ